MTKPFLDQVVLHHSEDDISCIQCTKLIHTGCQPTSGTFSTSFQNGALGSKLHHHVKSANENALDIVMNHSKLDGRLSEKTF